MTPRKSKKGARKSKGNSVDYFSLSRTLAASYVFVIPLFALYQGGLMWFKHARNGTESIWGELFYRLDWVGGTVVNLAVLGLLMMAIHRTRNKRKDLPGM